MVEIVHRDTSNVVENGLQELANAAVNKLNEDAEAALHEAQPNEPATVHNHDAFVQFAAQLHNETRDLFSVANKEYASDDAWTTNFDFVTIMMHIAGFDGKTPKRFEPRHAALCYAMKSVFSIAKDHSNRQSMRSRYNDVINYFTFMAWMDEHQHTANLEQSVEVPEK